MLLFDPERIPHGTPHVLVGNLGSHIAWCQVGTLSLLVEIQERHC